MKIDITPELDFRTARSGGKGGQHVNKTETMVEGLFDPKSSTILNTEQQRIVLDKLGHRLSSTGMMSIRSQKTRSQLSNKLDVIHKFNLLINQALEKKKIRISTNPSKLSKEKRIREKKFKGETKTGRRKISLQDL